MIEARKDNEKPELKKNSGGKGKNPGKENME